VKAGEEQIQRPSLHSYCKTDVLLGLIFLKFCQRSADCDRALKLDLFGKPLSNQYENLRKSDKLCEGVVMQSAAWVVVRQYSMKVRDTK